MRKRLVEQGKRWDLRFGVVASVAANFSMGKDHDQPPLTPADFFPSLKGIESEPETMTFDQIAAVFQSAAKR